MATTAPTSGSGGPPAGSIPDSGPVTPAEIYLLLIQQGYSTAQAVGIMANALNESGLSPEAHNPHDPTSTCPGAQSWGLLQWNDCFYPQAPGLVTGNPQSDIRAQIAFMSNTVKQSALAGATGAQVAGNFAQYFEGCQGCQPGGAQYAQRVANAATVTGWITSGKWPTSAGPGTGAAGSGQSTSDPSCMIQFPGVFGLGAACLFRTSWARALIGGALIGAAAPVGLVGAVVLAAFTFRGAGHVAGRVTEGVGGAVALVPGMQGAGAAVAALGSAEARHSQKARAQRDQRAQDRHDERVAREVEGRRRDSAKGPALRDDDIPPF